MHWLITVNHNLAYSTRYINKPIYVVTGTGDEFFMVDDARYYYDKLPEGTYLRYVIHTIKNGLIL